MKLYAYEQTVSDPCAELRHPLPRRRRAGGPYPEAPSLSHHPKKSSTISLPQLDAYTSAYCDGVMDAVGLKSEGKHKGEGYKFGQKVMAMERAEIRSGGKTAESKTKTLENNPHSTRPDTARSDMKQLIPYLQKEHRRIWTLLSQKDDILNQLCRTVLVSFTLLTATTSSDNIATYAPLCRLLRKMDTLEKQIVVRDVGKRPLLRPQMVSGPTSEQNKDVLDAVTKCRVRHGIQKKGDDGQQQQKQQCKVLRERQANNIVHLRVHSLFTLLPERWIDSACLDAYLHVLHRHFPKRDQLFLISAEHDPSFDQLIQSTQCYNYLLLPLYANKHWTLGFVNRPCAEIWYFNSDLTHGLQYGNVERQLKPYKEHFPTYHIEVIKVPEQTDTYSCGTFVAYFSYCLLFSPASLEKLKGWNADRFRDLILRQLCLSYLND